MKPKEYEKFLATKSLRKNATGIDTAGVSVNKKLFDFQRDIVLWALRRGRAAIFADTGLGKTFCQLEWARILGGRCLIIAPLSVARQTAREGKKINVEVKYVRSSGEVSDGINITNYEMIEHFDPAVFDSVVLDESSILKSFSGATRRKLMDMFGSTKYRLCCTATPAPNDQSEIANHSEFLGQLSGKEMLSAFFVHDGLEWRLKGHGVTRFYEWMASWAMSIRMPSDLGYDDDGFILPPLGIIPHFIAVDWTPPDKLFFMGLEGIRGRIDIRRGTINQRVGMAAELVNGSTDQWIVWCGMNEESTMLHKAIPDSVELVGADSPEHKAEQIEKFQDGEFRVLVTKPKIAGFGMNFQNSNNMAFVGLSDSFEAYYQCIRRSYRFGQKKPVNAHIILSEPERVIFENVKSKEEVARKMSDELIKNVQIYEREELKGMEKPKETYSSKKESGNGWTAINGDSCIELGKLKADSVDLSVYSPPFADLFTYSATTRDLGNSHGWDEFFNHFAFVIQQLLRVTRQGRNTCVHVSDIPAMLSRDGYIGMRDLPGAMIAAYIKEGWIFSGRVTIDKDPQAQAIRTKSKALLFVQMEKDSSWSRPAIGDYILIFRKPGENMVPITPTRNGEMSRETWIEWARPVWYNIQESDTLTYMSARDDADEKHICPLQLSTIERCIKLWSNPGETILTPFGGIGSEAYQAVKFGRKAILIELKEGYYNVAVRNIRSAQANRLQSNLFDAVEDSSGAVSEVV